MANPSNPDRPDIGQQSGKPSQGAGDYHLRCADVGYKDCPWEASGSTQDDVLRKAEQHGRQEHNLTNIDDDTRNRVRSQIHRAA